jgi:predicted dehydrogenase
LLVGHVLPFFPEYQWVRDVLDAGTYGRVRGGQFRRVVSDPAWLQDYWNPELVGGPMLDLHVHDAHFMRLLFGMPRSVVTRGRMRGPCAEAWTSLFSYEDGDFVVSATSGTIDQQGRPFVHGFEITLERATLAFEFAVIGPNAKYTCPPTLFGPDGLVEHPELGDGDPLNAFYRQVTEVRDAVNRGRPSPILSGELAADAITLCHAQTESLVTGQSVRIR